jgi:hypothetical protein
LFPLFDTGVIDTTCGKFGTGIVATVSICLLLVSLTSVANLPPAVQVIKFAAGVGDTSEALVNISQNF